VHLRLRTSFRAGRQRQKFGPEFAARVVLEILRSMVSAQDAIE